MSKTKWLGGRAEEMAANFLCAQGLKLACRNFQCKCGEIDLIMWDQGALVFIEVRLRNSAFYGDGLESVISTKQSKIIRAAEFYLEYYNSSRFNNNIPCRFDVVAIKNNQNNKPEISWIKDAFWLQ